MLATNEPEILGYEFRRKKVNDQALFESLVLANTNHLNRYAYWLCGNRVSAEDLVQETLMRAWKHLHKLRDAKAPKGYLTTILRREHARLYERPRVEIDSQIQPDDVVGTIDHDARPEAFALRKALARLPEKYREPLLLQVLGGFDLEEIASLLSISKGAAMTRVFRAKEKLRGILGAFRT